MFPLRSVSCTRLLHVDSGFNTTCTSDQTHTAHTQLTLLQEKNGCFPISGFHDPDVGYVYVSVQFVHIETLLFNQIFNVFMYLFIHPLALLGINAQARKLQKSRSRVTSTFMERTMGRNHKMWRSKSEMDLLDSDQENQQDADQETCQKDQSGSLNHTTVLHTCSQTSSEQNHIHSITAPSEGDAGSQSKTERLCPSKARGEREGEGSEREETESSDDSTTQYSIHPPHDCPYLLLLQGCSPAQVTQSHTDFSSDDTFFDFTAKKLNQCNC